MGENKNGQRESELHSLLHEAVDSDKLNKEIHNNPRLKIFNVVEKILGHQLSGEVIDVGAGSGYAGCWLAANRPDIKVMALECTKEAVEINIPFCAKKLNVEEKVTSVLGSFYDLSEYKEQFDYAFCFGSLHHSSNLFRVLKNINMALKPGGILILQEPFTNNMTTNDCFRKLYDMNEIFAGQLIKHGDRHDHFFRKCEYITALHYSGFEILHESNINHLFKKRNVIHFLITKLKRLFISIEEMKKAENFTKYREKTLKPNKWLAVCRKEEASNIPHIWDELL